MKKLLMQTNLEEMNKTMAFFMGATVITSYDREENGEKVYDHVLLDMCGKGREHPDSWHKGQRYWASSCLKYHSDWNELMRVIMKINQMNRFVSTERGFNTLQEFYRRYTKDWYALLSTIEEYHLAAYLFITEKGLMRWS
jgi:hypothetical protein